MKDNKKRLFNGIITGSINGRVQILDIITGKKISELEDYCMIVMHAARILRISEKDRQN